MDEGLTGDDTEEVNEALGRFTHVGANRVTAGGRIENGEIDVGVRVGGVEKAAEADGVGGIPELEDTVDVEEVIKEAAVLMPALTGSDGAEYGDEVGEVDVYGLELAAEEGPGGVQ